MVALKKSADLTAVDLRTAIADLARLADAALEAGQRARCVALIEEIYRSYGLFTAPEEMECVMAH